MYKIIGGDGNEYGPVSAETLRQWVAENRVNLQTQVRAETGDWKPLADFPELAGLASPAVQANATPPPFTPISGTARASYEGDYQLDIGGCISRGWELLKANFGVLFGGFMIYVAIQIVLGVLGMIPFIGTLFSLVSWVIAGPLMGGLLYYFLRVIRRETVEPFGVLDGFRSFGQLFLTQLVSGLLGLVCLLPAIVVGLILFLPAIMHNSSEPPVPQMIIVGAVLLVCLIPLIYISVNWMFALPLVLDRGLDFWAAMKLSWRRVKLHWWSCFGLSLLIGLLNVAGVLCCCVGVLITMPIGFAAMMYAYETIFSGSELPAA